MNDRELPSDSADLPAERPSVGERATQRTPAGAADDPRQPTLGLSPLAPRARSPLQLAPGDLLGSFRIERQLGRGAMGIVWQAYDTVGERAVVVKVLPAELQHSTDEMARVKHAFQRVQSLQHQHICPVYLLGEEPALGYYLVMRYVEGTTLAAFQHEQWARQGAFSLEQVCRVLMPVALALDYAHAQKVVHRDVKPQNIMVAEDGADVQVVDFGLAAEIRTSITRVSRVQMDSSGTYPYMAPEQWRGEYQDGQADQYALGVVAFELLTGRLPYQAPDDFVLRQCVLHEPVPEVTDQPTAVNRVIAKALAKKRGDRFESCAAFIRALEQPGNATTAQDSAAPQETEERRFALERLQGQLQQKVALEQESEQRRRKQSEKQRSEADRKQQEEQAEQQALRQGGILLSPKESPAKPPKRSAPHSDNVHNWPAAGPPGEVRRFEGHAHSINSLCYSPDGGRILSASSDRMVQMWDAQSGEWLYRFTEPRHQILSAVFSPDGRRVLAGGGQHPPGPNPDKSAATVRLYDVASWQELRRLEGHTAMVRCVAFAPDGRTALTGSFDQTMRLWDVETGRELRSFSHAGGWFSDQIHVLSVAFSPDGRYAASGNNDQTIRLWDVQSGQEVRRFKGHTHTIPSVAFSPDGSRLLSAGCHDNTMRLWDVATGREIRCLAGHSGYVWSVAFSPDGRRALSGSGNIQRSGFLWHKYTPTDCSVRLWDLETGVDLQTFAGHTTNVAAVAFAPDGRCAISGGGGANLMTGEPIDCGIRLWRLPP